jgi:ABC-type transport system involved in multi-copper enzyme maturation permease subunit
MTWLTWRQFRAQAIGAAIFIAVFAAIFVKTGIDLSHLAAVNGVGSCHRHGNCAKATADFFSQMRGDAIYPALLFVAGGIMLLTPALIGAFWGAPVVAREVEAGTFKLAWNQGITRMRWMVTKLSLVGLAAMATAGLLSLITGWWIGPIDQAGGFQVNLSSLTRFSPLPFATAGVAPLGYAAFAFTLGVAFGVLFRRTLLAMALTLAVFAVVAILVPIFVRPHLVTPKRATAPVTVQALNDVTFTSGGEPVIAVNIPGSPLRLPGAWVVSNRTETPSGQVYDLPAVKTCQEGTPRQCFTYIAGRHLHQVVEYQPASRYWEFQWYETGLYLALALALGGFCVVRIRQLS